MYKEVMSETLTSGEPNEELRLALASNGVSWRLVTIHRDPSKGTFASAPEHYPSLAKGEKGFWEKREEAFAKGWAPGIVLV